jgi:hypothetical protein
MDNRDIRGTGMVFESICIYFQIFEYIPLTHLFLIYFALQDLVRCSIGYLLPSRISTGCKGTAFFLALCRLHNQWLIASKDATISVTFSSDRPDKQRGMHGRLNQKPRRFVFPDSGDLSVCSGSGVALLGIRSVRLRAIDGKRVRLGRGRPFIRLEMRYMS